MFRFKQFTIHDERCAMKVGTDGTLLGAWTPVEKALASNVLDVGTGSGLIALMLAQRWPEAQITGIDIDADAVTQAADNFAASPWANRLSARHIALQDLAIGQAETYQLIVSNPPYFVDSLKNPDEGRKTARHTDTLSYSTLLCEASHLLVEEGRLALILPAEAESTIVQLGIQYQLHATHITRVCTKAGKPYKRVMMCLQKSTNCNLLPVIDTLCLIGEDGAPRSKAYQKLCNDFYL